MKKIAGIIVGILMVFSFSGAALAAFDSGSLVLSMYSTDDSNTTETGVSLLTVSEWDFTAEGYTTVAEGVYGNYEDLSTIMAGIWAFDEDTLIGYYATTVDTGAVISERGLSAFKSATDGVYSYYNSLGDDIVTGDTSNNSSYTVKMNSKGTVSGYFASLNDDTSVGEASLADLADGDVVLYLYAIDLSGRTAALFDDNTPVASIVLTAEGDVLVSGASAVPVPGAVWLLGSSLLGVVGLRRKKA